MNMKIIHKNKKEDIKKFMPLIGGQDYPTPFR